MKLNQKLKGLSISSETELRGAYMVGTDFIMLVVTENKTSAIIERLLATLNMSSAVIGAKVYKLGGKNDVKRKRATLERQAKT